MITLFISPSCTSCRKAKTWLAEKGLNFRERNIMANPISSNELKKILALSLEGTDDIISKRSKIFQKLNINIEDLSLSEMLNLVEKYPSLIRRPLIIDDKRLQIGFNEDEIRAFLPRQVRKVELRQAQLLAGF